MGRCSPMRRPPKYCHHKQDRRGEGGFWYYERKGYTRVRLPGLPWSPEFMRAYEGAAKAPVVPGESKTVQGTLNALIVSYYSSSLWQALKPSTQTTYRNTLELMRGEYGDRPVAMIERKHIRAIIEKKAQTPAAANRWLSLMVTLLELALDLEWPGVKSNPARAVKKVRYKQKGFHSWSDQEVDLFREHWPLGTRERLALELLLGTAQRSSDVRVMSPRQIAADAVSVVQKKTGAPVVIPLLPELKEAIGATTLTGADTILVTSAGGAFTEKYFYNWLKNACTDAGLSHCCPHGLRKAAARRLAEAGCTTHQIGSITGHATLKEVERYTRAANQVMLAKQAFQNLRGTPTEQGA
jgi:integrase